MTLFYNYYLSVFLFLLYVPISGLLFLVFYYLNLGKLYRVFKIRYFPFFISCVICGILSLGGLPPFGGFLIKFVPICLIRKKGGFFMLFFLVVGTLFSLFYYLRLMFNLGLLFFPVSTGFLIRHRTNKRPSMILVFLIGWFCRFSGFSLLLLDFF